MINESSRYQKGLKKLAELDIPAGKEVVSGLGDLGRYIVEFAFGDIYNREGISLRDRQIVTVAMLTALGGRETQLKVHLRAALNVGLTTAEIEEIIIQTIPFAGFPTAVNALALLKEVTGKPDNS